MGRSAILILPAGLALLLACRGQGIAADQALAQAPTSAELLAKAKAAYAGLASYADQGVQVTTISKWFFRETTERRFSTAFVRPGRFRFEFREQGRSGAENQYVIWQDHAEVKAWWSVTPAVRPEMNLAAAVAGATGVSGGTAYTIPSVLVKEAAWKGSTWTDPAGTYRIQDAVEAGRACYRIQRLTSAKAEVLEGHTVPATQGKLTYWLAKDDLTLLRLDDESDFGSFYSAAIAKYTPRINPDLPDSAFVFGH